MLTRLPRWVEVGAFLLAFLAGSVNAVGLLGFSHQSVSHLTGTTSLLGLALADLALTRPATCCSPCSASWPAPPLAAC